jgi:hypothetical protein
LPLQQLGVWHVRIVNDRADIIHALLSLGELTEHVEVCLNWLFGTLKVLLGL